MDFQYFFLHVIAFFVTALITLPRSFFEALLFQGSDIRYMKQKHLEMRLTHKTKLLAESYAFENVTKDANDFLSYLKLVMNSFLRTLNTNVGSVLIYNEEVQLLELKVYCDLKNEKNEPPPYLLKLGEEISGLSAESKQPLILLDTFKQPPAQAIQYENYLQGTVVSLPLMTGGRLLGVVNIVKKTGFFQKGNPLSDTDLDNLKLLEMEITRALMNFHLKQELEGIAFSTVKALVKALEAKDPYTKHHSENVAWYSIVIAREMNLSQTEMRDILFSCQLHDLGKIGINDEILMKKGPLNPQEWEIMKTHPTLGEEMLKPIKSLRNVALIIGQEHERYDGKGYPRALKGAEVLLTAQIVSVADAFDVITSKRSYKEAQSVEFALAEISRCSGTQFHPRVVQALLDAVNKNYSVIMEFLANRDVEGYVEGKIQEFLERSRIYL
jgi:HD-GYP domain-containing protein (c-di-GMP phosphodiesterase class II)